VDRRILCCRVNAGREIALPTFTRDTAFKLKCSIPAGDDDDDDDNNDTAAPAVADGDDEGGCGC